MNIDDTIRGIMTRPTVIAVVGLSPRTDRPAYGVAAFLQRLGHRIIPVNPQFAGETVLGEVIRPDFASIPGREEVAMINIFRRSEAVPPVVEAALADLPGLEVVWMQLGIANEEAAAMARAKGIEVIEDRCPKIEAARLGI